MEVAMDAFRFYPSMPDRNALTSSRCSHISRQGSDAASVGALSDEGSSLVPPTSPRTHNNMDTLNILPDRHLNPLSRQHSLFEDLSPIEEYGVLDQSQRTSMEPEEEELQKRSQEDERMGTGHMTIHRVSSDTEAELTAGRIRHLRRSKTTTQLVRRFAK